MRKASGPMKVSLQVPYNPPGPVPAPCDLVVDVCVFNRKVGKGFVVSVVFSSASSSVGLGVGNDGGAPSPITDHPSP